MNMAAQNKFGISAVVLKWIAVVTMVIDHFAASVYLLLPQYDSDIYKIMRKIEGLHFQYIVFCLWKASFIQGTG